MKKIRHIKLGTIVKDEATGLEGMLTHLQVEMDLRQFYAFQPRGLSPEDGKPLRSLWLIESRLGGKLAHVGTELPIEVLGTEVKDAASGFSGMAINLCQHISGCVHVGVQCKGTHAKTGAPVGEVDFDIRRLEGKAIKVLSEEERDADQKANPSPVGIESYSPRPV
jgi:hypothetical protein